MAVMHDLLRRVADAELRARLKDEKIEFRQTPYDVMVRK